MKVVTQKIEMVKNWLRPTMLTEIHHFLRLVGYYRRIFKGFSAVPTPLTRLTHKAIKFQWIDACEKSFRELKEKVTSTPVLSASRRHKNVMQYMVMLPGLASDMY